MALTNLDKPSTSLTNLSRASGSETWDSIPTTWASETRTWDATISLMTNSTRQTSSFTNTSKP